MPELTPEQVAESRLECESAGASSVRMHFYDHARTTLPAALDTIDALRQRVAELELLRDALTASLNQYLATRPVVDAAVNYGTGKAGGVAELLRTIDAYLAATAETRKAGE